MRLSKKYESFTDGELSKMLYEKHYLDVEDAYRKRGWIVDYDKPAYNETYDAFFEFYIKAE